MSSEAADLAAKREEERLARAFAGAKSPRSIAVKPAAAAAPKPAATPAVTAAKPAAAKSAGPAKPAPKQLLPVNGAGTAKDYTSARNSTLRGRRNAQAGGFTGKVVEDDRKLKMAIDGGYSGLEQLLQHGSQDVRNMARDAVMNLEIHPDSNEIGTFIADRLAPLVSLYTATDNISVRQLALWDLATMAAVSEARPAVSEKLGIDFVIKQLNDPDTEIVAAAATLLGNLAHQDDKFREKVFNEQGLAALIKLGQERKDSKLLCAVIFALGNMAATETHARQVEQAGGLAWVQQQLASPDAEIVRATWGSLSVFAKYDFARQKIVEAGAIKPLVALLRSTKDDLTFQYATEATVNLTIDGGVGEKFIAESGLLALERVSDDVTDLLSIREGVIKRPTAAVAAVQMRVAKTYRNLANYSEKSRAQLRQRPDSVAIVRALSRSDDARISAPAQECLKLLEQKEETQKPATPSVDYKGAVAPPIEVSTKMGLKHVATSAKFRQHSTARGVDPTLTQEEVAMCRAAFDRHDADKSGEIDEKELTLAMEEIMAHRMEKGNIGRLAAMQFQVADKDKSGTVEFEEFTYIYGFLKREADAKGRSVRSINLEEETRKKQEEEERKRKEEADKKAKEEADRKAKEEAERKAKEEADRKAKEEAERKSKADSDKAKAEAALKASQEAERKAKEAREEADRKAKEEADRKAKEEAERRARESEAQRKAREDAERKAKEERDRKAQEEERVRAAKLKAEEEERRKKLIEDDKRRAAEEEERRRKAAQMSEAERLRLEKEKAEALERERQRVAEAEAKARAADEERRKKEEENRKRLDKEEEERRARWRAEDEAKRKAEEDLRQKNLALMRQMEEEMRKLAEERAKLEELARQGKPQLEVIVERSRPDQVKAREAPVADAPKDDDKESIAPLPTKIDPDVAEMLHSLDLDRYALNFAHNNIRFDDLFGLRDKDLRDMGVDAVGPRGKILQAVHDLYADTLGANGNEAMRRLIKSLDSNDPSVVEDALEKMLLVSERSTKNRNALIVMGLIPVLVRLIRATRYVEIQAGAVKVLASLARESLAQTAVRNANGIEPVLYLANHKAWSDDVETLAHVLLCLKRLTADVENKSRLREANVAPDLVRIAHAVQSPAVRTLALDVVATLAIEDKANQLSLWQTNMALNFIMECFHSTDVELKEQATRALGALAADSPQFATLIYTHPDNVPAQLAELAHCDGEELLQSAALLALAQLSEGVAARVAAFKAARLPRRAVQLLRSRVERVQSDAAHAVKVLARHPATKREVEKMFYEGLVVGSLCDIAVAGTSEASQEQARAALFHIAEDSKSIAKVIYSSLGPAPILKGMQSERRATQYYSAGLLYYACRARSENRFEFITAGADVHLAEKLQSTDFNIRLGATAIDDLFRDALSPGPLNATAVAQ